MHPLVAGFLRRTAVGSVVIAVGVPMLQNQVFALAQSTGPALSVTGDISGLSTEHLGRLVLTVHNDGDATTVVHHLTTTVPMPVRGCQLSVAPWTGTMTVAAGGTATQALVVRLSGSRCAGAHWSLEYAVTA